MPDIEIGQQVHTVPMAFRYSSSALDEYLTEFQSSALVRTVAQMRNDPMIAEVIDGYESALLQADWRVEPASDTPEHREQAEFVSAVLFQQGDRKWWTDTSWRQRLTETCESMLYGFAAWGRRWEEVDGRYIPTRFSYIHPSTIQAFVLSELDESLQEIRRFNVADGPLRLKDPRERRNASLFAFAFTGVNYRGRPLIRPMWRGHAMGMFAHNIAITALQKRGSPMPVITQPKADSDDTSDAGKKKNAKLDKIAQSARGEDQAHAWARLPEGTTLGFASPDGEAMDAGPIIQRHATEILHAGHQAHKGRGDIAAGTQGGTETQSRDYYVFAQAIAESIAENLVIGCGSQEGDVWSLLAVNYGERLTDLPKVVVTNVDPSEATQNLPIIGDLIQKGAIKHHPSYELHLCRSLDIPPRPGLEDEAAMTPQELADLYPAPPPPPPLGGKGDPAEEGEEDDQDEAAAGLARSVSDLKKLPEHSVVLHHDGGRGPHPRDWFCAPTEWEEEFLNLGLIQSETNRFVDRYYAAASRPLQQIDLDVIDRTRRGIITTKNYPTLRKGIAGPSLKYEARVRDKILGVRKDAARFGALQIRDELAKQRAFYQMRPAQAAALPKGPRAVELTADEILTGAIIDAGWLIDRLTSAIIAEFERLALEDLTQGELAARLEIFLSKFSDKPIRDLGRQSVTKAFNLGRNLEVQRQADSIAFVARTAVLDGHNPCGPCRGLDGKKFNVNSAAYVEFAPPAKCEGQARCWCFYVAFAEGAEEMAA